MWWIRVIVQGNSMSPTLRDGQRLLARRLRRDPRRSEVIVFRVRDDQLPHRIKRVAAVATDTWGVEVRPNETDEANQPWHWICIPIMGLTMGEIFKLDELAKACAGDKAYEFMFVAPALPITGAVGSPVNPIAIR